MKKKSNLVRFIPYFKEYKKELIIDLLCAALTTGCEIALPLIVKNITEAVSATPMALTLEIILVYGCIYIGLKLVDVAAYYYMATFGHVMGSKIETNMRRDLFKHLQKLSNSYYDNTKIGQIMARITSDLFDVTEFAHHCPEEFFITGIKVVVAFIILFTWSPLLAVVVLFLMPFMVICTTRFRRKMRKAFKESRHQIGELNAQVEDSLLGIRVVKSFANEHVEEEKFRHGNSSFLNIKKFQYTQMGGFQSTVRLFDGLMYIAVVMVGGIFLLQDPSSPLYITPGVFMGALLFVTTLINSVRRIIEFQEQFQRGMTGIDRFYEIMDTPVEIVDDEDAEVLENVVGKVEFKNVSFNYKESEDVLKDVSFTIGAGEHVALVGPSGGGKTTICNLIPRFYEIYDGDILVDGKPINKLTLESLRNNIGVVQQDVYLFSGTVYENIVYGKLDASKEEVIEAAKNAGAHEFIMALPNGYDTYVGERGVKLSGGQKQRISIARVFLKNPPILILDEATSALDNESERVVQESLERLAKGRTTLTIAHRLTTIKNANKIYFVGDSRILEEGSHKELLEKKGLYYHLYSMYLENNE
ncbi:MAG: ABC transporter ATP-binding protein [Bacilli bacterium]|nr:ABC transporter ATP-binding protein [Bacilli bacterium]